MSIQRSSSSSARWKYDVFLSFRGVDTRKNFTGHLYTALAQKGIHVFRDDRELERGKSISPELLQAIEESRISIIVFSTNYASSDWCLDEIVKIVECKNTMGQHVLPIFYDVAPSVVRNQTRVFQEAFGKHEENFKEDNSKIQQWRNALTEVATLSGWYAKDRVESELIQEIVQEISIKLDPTTLMNFEDLVGIEPRLKELRLLMGNGSNDVRMIGIWGMGGIGKTTIARAFYDLVSKQFERSCFLANVRETSEKSDLITLQKQFLSEILKGQENNIYNIYDGMNMIKNRLCNKKVLVVIDDVVHIEQLNKLAGKHDWFGLGSRIIITTRNKHLLVTHEVDKVYEAKKLNHDESLQLLILKAFKNDQPSEEYRELSELVVRYADGLPLALEVLGSFLFGRPIGEWNDTIERLKKNPNKEILDKLEIGFDGLDEREKKVFLDIACFFKGMEREYVTSILDGCDFNPKIGISVLLEKSLITVSKYGKLRMHDLLQEMGRQIVKRESYEEPGERSRLWDEKDIRHVLTKNTGTKRVEAIILEKELHISVGAKVFSKMINLRLLKIRQVQLPKGLKYLSHKLRLLDWDRYSLKSLPSNLQMENLVQLEMKGSRIKQLWKENVCMSKLKLISFKDCKNLNEIPEFRGIPNLEELNLEGCSRLSKIHQSVLVHKKIKRLDLMSCLSLTTLPSEIRMESLEFLRLFGCRKLKKFPEITESMECLHELNLEFTAIEELHSSIGRLVRLKNLKLYGCKNLLSLPSTINDLKSLERLQLGDCSKLNEFPEITGSMECLHELDLGGTAIEKLHSSIGCLVGLQTLDLCGCENILSLPSTIDGLKSLERLDLSNCSKLKEFPKITGNMECLHQLCLNFTAIEELHLSRGLVGLQTLKLYKCKNLLSLSSEINDFKSLKILELGDCSSLTTLPSELQMESLEQLNFFGCSKLKKFPEIKGGMKYLHEIHLKDTAIEELHLSIELLVGLTYLNLEGCNNLLSLPEEINSLRSLKTLLIDSCSELASLPSTLDGLESLEILVLSGCPKLKKFPEIKGSMVCLRVLRLHYTAVEELPPSIECLVGLRELNLDGCKNLVSLPTTIGVLNSLEHLSLQNCTSLQILSQLPSNIHTLKLDGCVSLETLPNPLGMCGYKTKISCQDCLKLHNVSRLAFSMLKEHFQEMKKNSYWPIQDSRFSTIVPGSEFPEWFKHKSVGSSLKIEKLPYLYDNRKLVGYIVCCVVVFYAAAKWPLRMLNENEAVIIMIGDSNEGNSRNHEIDFDYGTDCSHDDPSDHLWLCYLPCGDDMSDNMNTLEGPGRLSIGALRKFDVRRCGFHPVYEHEHEDLNKSIQDFVESTTQVKSGAKNLHLGGKCKVQPMIRPTCFKFLKANLGVKRKVEEVRSSKVKFRKTNSGVKM